MKQLCVLIVEDSPPMLGVVKGMMEIFGFGKIITATDGEQAFQLYQHHKPDLIITDWHMENVDGLELVRWIRRNKHSVNRMVPIILMTGYSDAERIGKARDLGVTEVLLKPFSAHDMARRIMHVIDVPRDFIETLNFFGPDRRRRPDDNYEGEDRRVHKAEEIF